MNLNPMISIKNRLFDAFRADHAVLGRGLYSLATHIRAGEEQASREAAAQLAKDAGPHIAFEEADFYPALSGFLSQDEIDEMYADHENGRMLIKDILVMKSGALADQHYRDQLLARIEAAEAHVSECGELFGVMGGLTGETQMQLLTKLEAWREQSPSWLEI